MSTHQLDAGRRLADQLGVGEPFTRKLAGQAVALAKRVREAAREKLPEEVL